MIAKEMTQKKIGIKNTKTWGRWPDYKESMATFERRLLEANISDKQSRNISSNKYWLQNQKSHIITIRKYNAIKNDKDSS
jgi:hypothetical protein